MVDSLSCLIYRDGSGILHSSDYTVIHYRKSMIYNRGLKYNPFFAAVLIFSGKCGNDELCNRDTMIFGGTISAAIMI